jgi:hypothetical protein
VLAATRPQIELYIRHLEVVGLAASTIDRRLSTVCGFYRFAHIDGVIASNPAQYVRRPKIHPSEARGLDRGELGAFLFTAERYDQAHAALAVLLGLNGLRVCEACSANIEELGFDRGHRTLRIVGKGNKPALVPLVPRTARTWTWPSASAAPGRSCCAGTASVSTGAPPIAGWPQSDGGPGWAQSTPTCSGPRSSWPRSMPGCPCARFSSPPATPTPGPRPSTTIAARTSTAALLTLSPHSSLEVDHQGSAITWP